ncbi:MAG: hypothetical protein D6736_00210 [Nitrospinota bacterium]|nr:MAG: hypothetical protein D6736_00210 [Nitrospinota bacterium]
MTGSVVLDTAMPVVLLAFSVVQTGPVVRVMEPAARMVAVVPEGRCVAVMGSVVQQKAIFAVQRKAVAGWRDTHNLNMHRSLLSNPA